MRTLWPLRVWLRVAGGVDHGHAALRRADYPAHPRSHAARLAGRHHLLPQPTLRQAQRPRGESTGFRLKNHESHGEKII